MRVDRCSVEAQNTNKLLVKEEKIIITIGEVRIWKGAIIFSIGVSPEKLIKLSIKISHYDSIQRNININKSVWGICTVYIWLASGKGVVDKSES